MAWQAVAIRPEDDVAVLLIDAGCGDVLSVRVGDRIESLVATEAIPMGHKLARRAIAAHSAVRKYGEVIGEATGPIAAGAHVHVHNLRSLRARPRAEPSP